MQEESELAKMNYHLLSFFTVMSIFVTRKIMFLFRV